MSYIRNLFRTLGTQPRTLGTLFRTLGTQTRTLGTRHFPKILIVITNKGLFSPITLKHIYNINT